MGVDKSGFIVRIEDMPSQADTTLKSMLRQAAGGRTGRKDMLTKLPTGVNAATTTKLYLRLNSQRYLSYVLFLMIILVDQA